MAADVSLLLQVLNVLIVPALVYVVRIDRRVAQLDTVQDRDGRQLEKLERAAESFNQRLIRLECK
jgi:hypothetical protein